MRKCEVVKHPGFYGVSAKAGEGRIIEFPKLRDIKRNSRSAMTHDSSSSAMLFMRYDNSWVSKILQ